jgi:hypothetical protein
LSAGLIYAYWDSLSVAKDETIVVGEGTSVEVVAVAEAPPGKTLVPAGVVMGPNDVTSIELTYNVKLSKQASTALNLSVVASDKKIAGDSAYGDLVNVGIVKGANTVNNTNVLVTVTVTLSAPGSAEVYEAIKNENITFTLTFSASS